MKEMMYGFKKEENTIIPALIGFYRRKTEEIVVAEISGKYIRCFRQVLQRMRK